MPNRFVSILSIAILAGTCAPGCEREERGFRIDPANVETVAGRRDSGLYPGPHALDPSQLKVAASTYPAGATNAYEGNAYALAEGKRFYQLYNCVGCHANGGGGIGPPLMDDQWTYGSAPEQIVETIVNGRPHGMPAFGGRIPEFQVWQLAAYVRSMSGLASPTAAPSRSDHMRVKPAENSMDPQAPRITPGANRPEAPQPSVEKKG